MLAPRKPRNIFGMMRGGMSVALYVAHELGLDAYHVFPLYPIKNSNRVSSPVRWPHTLEKHTGLDSILIDDILDSGKTEEDLQCTWPWLKVAVLYCKNRVYFDSLVMNKPVIGRFIETEDYLVLPHEVLPEEVERT
jgi:hypoxanthine phosphoribosyltransferase